MRRSLTFLLTIVSAWFTPWVGADTLIYDAAIVGGLVIDPAGTIDGQYNVGVIDGKIAVVTEQELSARNVINAEGNIVTAGFIDLHSHAQTPLGQRFQALDGVTTALDLEAGAYPVGAVGNKISGEPLINFGASVSYASVRTKVVEDRDVPYLFFGDIRASFDAPGFNARLTPQQIIATRRHLHLGLDQGGIGIGVLLDYMSAAVSDAEMQMLFEVAAERKAPLFIHIRRGFAGDPAGLIEVIELARSASAAVHVCHLNASAMGGIDAFLELIARARQDGIDVTSESYPYNAGSTSIGAEVFGRDWQKVFAISYEDVQVAATGERLTEARWRELRETAPGTSIIHHYGREPWTQRSIAASGAMVGSDAMPVFSEAVKAHPRGMGTFTRVLGRYVREEKLLSIGEALAKMSYLPAKRLETIAPRFANKGRLQPGADADLVVFDPTTVTDRATYANPFQAPAGISLVMVNGQVVVRDGKIEPTYPGRILIGGG